MKFRILITDDERNIREGLSLLLQEEGYETVTAEHGKDAITLLNNEVIDLVLSDLRMGPISGENLLQHIVSKFSTIPVIIFTGHGTVENAVEAMHRGAYDYLTKPLDIPRLLLLIKRALQTRSLALRNREIEAELNMTNPADTQIMIKSTVMQRVMDQIQQVAPTNSSILITGESGVGKEVICKRLHTLSRRSDKPLISVHCAALSESLLESELFGHEKGSFTGAIAQKKGRFELADGGIIFLDEIGEINQNTQIKLLRVLQEQKFERVGGEKTIEVDVRVFAATNKNLKEEVDEGRFRGDLYYRLSVVNIHIPSLMERKEDIVLYAQNFLRSFAKENQKDIIGFDKKALQSLGQYTWPGNIRELRNCIESAVVMSQGTSIQLDDMPAHIREGMQSDEIKVPMGISLKDLEKQYIHTMLIFYKGNKSKTAKILEIGRKTLHNKITEYGLSHIEL